MNTRLLTLLRTLLLTFSTLTGLACLASPGWAQTAEVITLNTSTLAGGGAYFLDFQLVDGGLTGDSNSLAKLTGFSSSGLSFGPAQSFGTGVSGTLPTGLTMTDSDLSGVDEYQQKFTAGPAGTASQFQFTLRLAPTSLDAPTPDTFSFAVLNSGGSALPTNDPTGGNLVASLFTSLSPPLDPAYHTVETTGSPHTPFLQPTFSAPKPVPEASSVVSMGLMGLLGLGGLVAARRRKA